MAMTWAIPAPITPAPSTPIRSLIARVCQCGGVMVASFEHPRPLLRRAWQSLDGVWDFALEPDAERPERVAFDRQIVVPFAPETPASGIEVPTVARCWYRRSLTVEPPAPKDSIQLHFGGVDRLASVWVNGALVAEHEGGYTGFSCDATDAAADGELR